MFFLIFLLAVIFIVGLSVLGAWIVRRAPGTHWQSHEDTPVIGPHDHF